MDKATLDKMKKYASENSEFTADCNSLLALLDYIERLEAEAARMREMMEAARLALRSYQYGNSGADLAEEVADACDKALAPEAGREWLTRYRAMRDLFEQAWVKWGQSGVKMSDAALYGECERMLKRLDGKE